MRVFVFVRGGVAVLEAVLEGVPDPVTVLEEVLIGDGVEDAVIV